MTLQERHSGLGSHVGDDGHVGYCGQHSQGGQQSQRIYAGRNGPWPWMKWDLTEPN